MLFDTLTGNDRTVAAMKNMVATGRVPHAILLYENDGGGAFPLCLPSSRRCTAGPARWRR